MNPSSFVLGLTFPLVYACTGTPSSSSSSSSSSGAPVEDSGTPVDDTGPSPDAGKSDAASVCGGKSTCKVDDDCRAKEGGLTGCWSCSVGCCVPIAAGRDPSGACVAGATACKRATCDGMGGCSQLKDVQDGVACGQICFSDVSFATAICSTGVCRGDGVLQFCPQTTRCSGSADNCSLCPPAGCPAACKAGGTAACPP
jgi:hypothetical protein